MSVSDEPQSARSDAAIYAIVPRAVLADRELSAGARLLYALIDSHQTSKSRVRLTQALLADELGVSVRMIGTYLAELAAAEWLSTGRTGRSSSYRVVNPSRQRHTDRTAEQLLTAAGLEPAAVSAIADTEPAPAETAAALSALLSADRRPLVNLSTRPNRAALARALGRGWTLPEIADRLSGVKLESAHTPGGLLSSVLEQLAAEPTPREKRAEREQQRQRDAEQQRRILAGELTCSHGEPRGPESCPLCRRAAADIAVGIAAALAPERTGADQRARESLADQVMAADPPADEQLAQLVDELATGLRADRSA